MNYLIDKQTELRKAKLIKIMQIDKNYRTNSDIEFLFHEYKHLDYFRHLFENYGDLILTNVLKCMNFKELKKGETIYKYSDNANYCYIILKGSVDLFIPKNKLMLQNSVIGILAKKLSLNFNIKKVVDKEKKPKLKSEKEVINSSTGSTGPLKRGELSHYSSLAEGVIFGDKEISTRKNRQHTAKCKTNCLLGELSKIDFINIFENTKRLENNEELKFFNSIKILQDCQSAIVDRLQSLFEKKSFNKGEVIAKQWSEFNNIYLIRKGSCEVVYKYKENYTSDFDLNYFAKLNDKKERFTSNRVFELRSSYKQVEDFKV